MGFLDFLKGSGKDDKSSSVQGMPVDKKFVNPFSVSLSFLPLRLSANKKNSVNLIVRVKNVSPESHLVSIDALLPREAMLGFDEACINKAVEKKGGELCSGESTDIQVTIWANNQSKLGNHKIDVTIYSHYRGYDKVLSYVKKSTSLRVV
ncbi:hypothetical protein KKF81_07205 [Candidatus Micrarchaeota archaeon]|nr:hypothetical protein [Candidatus Micrarchaeota archaeon]MBU1166718.1 hypothetical protein [Candidatus Micrarchaeota archaeon]MBU1886643.1 hypothetical protein [Candidatus Micrarchaeota archaeon]